MKSTNNYDNIKGLAKQAARKWKCDHVLYEFKKGQWKFEVDKGKINGEKIVYKELIREDKKAVKEQMVKSDKVDKPKKDKAVS